MGEFGGVHLTYLHPDHLSASFGRSLMDLIVHDQAKPSEQKKSYLPWELPLLRHWTATRAQSWGIAEARNTATKYFREETKAEWMLSVDADMGFAPWTLDQLVLVAVENDVKIVGGLCFAWKESGPDGMNGGRHYPMPTIYDYGLDAATGVADFRGRAHYPVNELVPVKATGAAMVLIHRDVVEAIYQKHGDNWWTNLPRPADNSVYGEDISFFIRSGELGFQPYVHTGIRTTHHKSLWVAETDFWESFNAPPATETVDVIVPTVKERVGNIRALAESLRASTGLARLLLVVDDEEHAAQVVEFGETTIRSGSFARKINHAYPLTRAPWVQVVGDDCRFHPGWLDHQLQVAGFYGAKVVGSNDMANPRVVRGEHATHWMIARDYIDELGASWDGPGVVAHEGYRHWFVDDEIVTVAKLRGVFQVALGARIEHLHPITGKAVSDEVYERNDRYAAQDHDLFRKRVQAHAGGE